jgi:uncharacterized protein
MARARRAPYGHAMDNVQTVQDIYEAFGRGDIPAILDRLAPDVRWDELPGGGGAAEAAVPWLLPRRGPQEVGEFFETLRALEFHRFQPLAFMAGDDRVAAVIDVELTVRDSGRSIRDEELHLWTFDDRGRVSRFRHYVDTAQHVAANAAATPTR